MYTSPPWRVLEHYKKDVNLLFVTNLIFISIYLKLISNRIIVKILVCVSIYYMRVYIYENIKYEWFLVIRGCNEN